MFRVWGQLSSSPAADIPVWLLASLPPLHHMNSSNMKKDEFFEFETYVSINWSSPTLIKVTSKGLWKMPIFRRADDQRTRVRLQQRRFFSAQKQFLWFVSCSNTWCEHELLKLKYLLLLKDCRPLIGIKSTIKAVLGWPVRTQSDHMAPSSGVCATSGAL